MSWKQTAASRRVVGIKHAIVLYVSGKPLETVGQFLGAVRLAPSGTLSGKQGAKCETATGGNDNSRPRVPLRRRLEQVYLCAPFHRLVICVGLIVLPTKATSAISPSKKSVTPEKVLVVEEAAEEGAPPMLTNT